MQILLTVDQRAHFQEQNKFIAPINERLDFGLKERINERSHDLCN